MSILDTFDGRDQRYFTFVLGRSQDTSDKQIAEMLNFPSPSAMYSTFAAEGYPVCRECGAPHPDGDHACKQPVPKKKAHKSKGEIKELPDAVGAMPLFEEALAQLRRGLAWLPKRREYLKGRRFFARHELSGERGESVRVYERDIMGPKRRQAWCEERGLDPTAEAYQVPHDVDAPLDVPTDHPAEPLPALIAAYALTGWDVDELVEQLHPRPERVNLDELNKEIARLRRKAELVAAVVRGGTAGAGKRAAEIASAERRLATHIRELQDRGWFDELIAKRLRDGGFEPLPEGFELLPEGRWPTDAEKRRAAEEVRRVSELDLD